MATLKGHIFLSLFIVNRINGYFRGTSMLLNLYGDSGLVFQVLATGFKEAHLQDRLRFEVVEAEKVGQKFRDAVKKTYNAKFLDDADMVIRFAEPKVEEPVGDEEGGEGDSVQADSSEEKTQTPEKGGDGEVNEAKTTASGAELKKKIIDTVKRCLYQQDADKIELSDLDGLVEGYNVSFIKVSFKSKDSAGG